MAVREDNALVVEKLVNLGADINALTIVSWFVATYIVSSEIIVLLYTVAAYVHMYVVSAADTCS